MPGLTGVVAAEARGLLDGMEAVLFPVPGQGAQRGWAPGFAFAVRGTGGFRERAGVWLAFEGHLLGRPFGDGSVPEALLGVFLERGERFLEGLDGSFQVLVRTPDTTYLFMDPTASRRWFFRHAPWGLAFSPEVAPLRALAPCTVDGANLAQFLVGGRFFAGHTLLEEVHPLLPGEHLVHRDGRVERRRAAPDTVSQDSGPLDVEATLTKWGEALERAVLQRWMQARAPALLLTGGWDSRFLFHTVARHVEDTTRLCTVTWGQDLRRLGSDARVAHDIARRFGTRHLELKRCVAQVPETFAAMFQAQSGMTELAFGHADELTLCQQLADRHGVGSLFRGDECFGPTGWNATTEGEVLARLSLPFTADVAGREAWLVGGGADAWAAREEQVRKRVAAAPGGVEALRDTLYFRERVPAFLHHLNYFKAHRLEVFNPLMDREVLALSRALPAAWRTDKRLFKDCYRRQFAEHLDIPFAERSNGVDWARLLKRSPRVVAFLRAGLEALPPPLVPEVFVGVLDGLLRGAAPPPAPGAYRVAPEQLVMRAFVLGQWLRDSPTSDVARRAKRSRARAAPASEVSAKHA
ncbi:asparagine synthase-related protein [Corallococcus llansteffanensis]|nr:asparagine synthase-related protein [Corallococcus llansteffanensis]